MTEDEITNEARSEFDKNALWQAKDTIREANETPTAPAAKKENLDIIKHLIKRLDVHQVISNKKAQKTNFFLLFLSVIMALQAGVYIYDWISNNHINMAKLDMLTLHFDRLFIIVAEVLLLYTGYKIFVFGVNRILGIEIERKKETVKQNTENTKENVKEKTERATGFEATIKVTFWGASIGGLIIIGFAVLILFSSLLKVAFSNIAQSESTMTSIPAAQDSTISSTTQSGRIIEPSPNKIESKENRK